MEQVEVDAGGGLQADEELDGGFPDDTVIGGVGLGVGQAVALPAVPELLLDVVHQRLVMGVHHQRHVGRGARLHDLHELAVIVDADARHVRVVPARVHHHEHLERGDALLRQLGDLVGDGSGRVDVVVDDGLPLIDPEQLLEARHRVGRRDHVGHGHGGGDTACRALHGGRVDVLLVGVSAGLAALAVVRMHVHRAGDQCEIRRVHHFGGLGRGAGLIDSGDGAVLDADGAFVAAVGVDNLGIGNQHVEHGNSPWWFSAALRLRSAHAPLRSGRTVVEPFCTVRPERSGA